MADDIWGIGFKRADTIASKLGFEKEKYVRLRSGLLYTLNKLSEEGHCYALRGQLLEKGSELLGVDASLLTTTLDEMISSKDVITSQIPDSVLDSPSTMEQLEEKKDSDCVAIYLPPFFFSELGTAKRLMVNLVFMFRDGTEVGV